MIAMRIDKHPFREVGTDVLIVGAGAAGLRAAIELAENSVWIVSCSASAATATRTPFGRPVE
jgi:succinate dehydrogenase/fumarate reductase flavoprotein subunit